MQQCPRCEDQSLRPIQPVHGLVARQCGECEGMLLDLLAYRQWRETHLDQEGATAAQLSELAASRSEPESEAENSDTARALLCTRCQRIMTKYRVTDDSDRRLDFCVHCADVWLDWGELELLNAPELDGDLGRVFAAPWQRQLVDNKQQQMAQERLAEHLGSDLTKVESFAQWLAEHPQRSRIMAFISDKLR